MFKVCIVSYYRSDDLKALILGYKVINRQNTIQFFLALLALLQIFPLTEIHFLSLDIQDRKAAK